MTYLEYADKLVGELCLKRVDAIKKYESLSRNRDGLNFLEANLYLKQVDECHAIADLAENIMKGLLDGYILPFDQID